MSMESGVERDNEGPGPKKRSGHIPSHWTKPSWLSPFNCFGIHIAISLARIVFVSLNPAMVRMGGTRLICGADNWIRKTELIEVSSYGKCQRFIICSESGMLKAFHSFCNRSRFWQRDWHVDPHTFQSSVCDESGLTDLWCHILNMFYPPPS